MSNMQIKQDGYGQTPEAVAYWVEHRSKIADLYDSEKHFFVPIVKNAKRVLDIGCAAGGSALFTHEVNPSAYYVGIDISSELISAAHDRLKHLPGLQFLQFDGVSIPLPEGSVDFCFSFGVFHHLNHWKSMITEALRVTSRYFLFDLRLWHQDTLVDSKISYQKLALSGMWDQKSIIPYNIISMDEFKSMAHEFTKVGISCKAYGYFKKTTDLAVTPAEEVLMLSILLEKNVAIPNVELNITSKNP
jgi:SAM-dependent methyltransferase